MTVFMEELMRAAAWSSFSPGVLRIHEPFYLSARVSPGQTSTIHSCLRSSLPWAREPQMRQDLQLCFLSSKIPIVHLRKSLSWTELSLRFPKKEPRCLRRCWHATKPSGDPCLQSDGSRVHTFPEGGHRHRGPCSYCTSSQNKIKDCRFNSILTLIDVLMQRSLLSPSCDKASWLP